MDDSQLQLDFDNPPTEDELRSARVLIETGLDVSLIERRHDGGWILWHDPIMATPGAIPDGAPPECADQFWASVEAAMGLLEAHGWLITSDTGLATVFAPGERERIAA